MSGQVRSGELWACPVSPPKSPIKEVELLICKESWECREPTTLLC